MKLTDLYQHHFGAVSPLFIFNPYFYKKLSLYIHTPIGYLGLGFEFEYGPQRIRDLAFLCPKSVSIPYMQKSELGCAASRDLLSLKLVSQIVETIEACVNVWH